MKRVAAFILKLSTDRRLSGQGQSGHKKLFEEVDKSSGEVVNLNLMPVIQCSLWHAACVFVPTLKSLKNSKNTLSRTDATEELTRLSLARVEGFDKVEITGPRLDMDNDFKTG
ncbi:RepFIB replication protein A [Escherichia coli]|nr:RepFIB replication protein A [Escherichia coli]